MRTKFLPFLLLIFWSAACARGSSWASGASPSAPPPSRAPLATPTLLFVTPETGAPGKAGQETNTPAIEAQGTRIQGTNPQETPTPQASKTVTPPPVCAYVWASQPLPEAASTLSKGLQASGLTPLEVQASTYGENCLDSSGSLVSFSAMQTDYSITLQVNDLADTTALGQALYISLLNLQALLPVEKTPGPNPGQLTFVFSAPTGETRFSLSRAQAIQALQAGQSGSEILPTP